MRLPHSPSLVSLTIAASIACSSWVAPNTAFAGAPSAEAEEDPAFTEAKKLYKDGEIKFQTADYEDALALWKNAFAILPTGDEYRSIRHALVYNIAEAHSRAYEVSRNPTHLRKAKMLLESYRADHQAMYGDDPAAVKERSEVDDRITELDKKIAESEAAGEAPTPINEEVPATQVQPETPPETQPSKPLSPQKQWEAEVKADPALGPAWETGTKRVVGGSVLLGVGGLCALISIASFSWSTVAFLPGAWYGVGGVTGAAALGMFVGGPIMIATGVKKRHEVMSVKPKPTAHLVPMLTPSKNGLGFAGLGLVGRF